MDVSHTLARMFGIVFIVMYGGLLVNNKFYFRIWKDILHQPLLLFFSGFIALILGLLVIQFHNIWTPDWKGLITLFGWLMFFQGVFRIVLPETVLKLASKITDHKMFINIASVVMLLIGLYLTSVSFLGA